MILPVGPMGDEIANWIWRFTMRCLECGADPAEFAQVCVRCEAPIGLQQLTAGAATASSAQVRCLECGADPAEIAQVCVRCKAPVSLQQPPAWVPPPAWPPLPQGTLPGQPASRGPSRRKIAVWVSVGVVLTVAAWVAAIAVVHSSRPANQLTSDQLRPGDCLMGSNLDLAGSDPWPDTVTRVACIKPHVAEVFFDGDIWPQSQAFPGKDAIVSQVDDRCGTEFAAYDGVDSGQSKFTFTSVSPLDSSDWNSGDRHLVCVAYISSPSGPSGGAVVSYSLKGSNR